MKTIEVILLFFVLIISVNAYNQNQEEYEKIKEINLDSVASDSLLRLKASDLYRKGFELKKQGKDSAYKYFLESKDLYLKLKDSSNIAKRMYSLAAIESEKSFYKKSEGTAIEALRYLGGKGEVTEITLSLYNLLGTNANDKEDYEGAVRWYNKAIENVKDSIRKIRYQSNIAYNLICSKKYEQARDLCSKLKKSFYFDSIPNALKAKILDNYAYARLLNNEAVIETDFLEGQRLKRIEGDITGLASNYNYLNTYHYKKGNILKARYYAELMYDLAIKHNLYQEKIDAIDKILLLEPPSKIKKLSLERSHLKDSIHKENFNFVATIYNFEEEALKRSEAERNLTLANAELEKKVFVIEQQRLQKIIWIFATTLLFLIFAIYFFYKKGKIRKEKIIETYKTETRLAKRIHDELANDVYLAMNRVQHSKSIDLSLLNYLEKIYLQTRNISHENSPVLTGKQFESFFKQLLSEFSTDTCRILNKGISEVNLNKLSKEKQIVLYRVFQELLINMKKYSKASLVFISFKEENDMIHVTFKDNGVGANALKIKNGLQNMETRIKSVNGSITFDSELQKGFEVKFQIKK